MRKLLSVLFSTLQGGVRGGLLFVVLFATTSLWAYDFQSGDLYFNITNDTIAPYTIEVTYQRQHSTENYAGLTTVTIPEAVIYNGTTYSVTSIGDHAFAECSSLISITIPNSVTSIRDRAFAACHSLTSITIPNSVTSIETHAFFNCNSLTSITIPEGVTDIGDYAFRYCSSLTSITIPNSVTSVGNYAFSYCSSLTSITIPNSVTSIGEGAFSSCPSLTSIVVERSNITYDSRNNCNAIIETATNTLIAGCKNTTIPNSVTSIGYGAFEECSSLTSITIPNSVTSIGERAFCGCSSLTSITIPNSVTSIGERAFCGCSSLTSITIPNSVTSIGYYAFYGCSALISVTIPNSVTSIGERAFYGCSSLTSVTIPNSVTSIGESAFSYCSSLTSITIPNSVTSIGGRAFSDCSSLTSITIPNSVTSIEGSAFSYCSSLTSITIPNSVTSIEGSAFFYCSSLTSITIPNSVTSIGQYAFYNCSSLTSIIIPNSVTSIGYGAFQYCFSLISITLPESITSIADNAFAECSSLISITIPNSVTSIGKFAFYGCSNIEIITIGTKVENIGSYAFIGIDNCASIYSFAAVPPTLGDYTFGYTSVYSRFADQLIVHANSKEAYENDKSWNNIADRIIAIGDMYLEKSVQIDYTSASFNIRVLNYDKNEEYKMGYIWNKDTINVGMVDTIKLNLTDLFIDTDYRIIFFATKVDEPIEKGLRLSLTFRTKAIPISIDVISSTQTKMKVSLNCDSSKVAIKEQGIMMTHPNGQVDTIKFIINQTDTIIQGLTPNSEYSLVGYCIVAESNQILKSATKKITTKDIEMDLSIIEKTQTTIQLQVSLDIGDAAIKEQGIMMTHPNGQIDTIKFRINQTDTIIQGLTPNSEYSLVGYCIVAACNQILKSATKKITTKDIEMDLSIIEKTQTTIQLQVSLDIGDAAIEYAGIRWNSDRWYDKVVYYDGGFNLDTVICNLTPGYYYTFEVFVLLEGHEYDDEITMQKTTQTKSVYASEPRIKEVGQTYAILSVSNYYGDATLVNEMIHVNGVDIEITNRNEILVNNLNPNITYSCRSMISTVEGGTEYSDWVEFTTKPLIIATGDADGISNNSAFLHGTIDCDTMSRTEIGFEWKRSDAPSTVKPQRLLVVDRVDENLIFRLEGLSSDRYYDFRTFCLYNGKEYYGEWVGFLTSDKDILIPPSVQTREAEITDLGVLMKGFVVAGTEVILQRGFECWREESDQVATTVAEGAIMSSYIPEAWSYTTYKYRAYAKTPAGTTYGETLEVTTEYIATNIADIIVNASSNSAQVTWTMVEQADYYILTLYSDESMTEVIAVYTVDKNGNVTQKRVASATQSLVTCELTELLPETNYYFAVKAYNSADQMVAEENGAFATTQIPTSVENTHTQSPMTNCQKILRDGQLLILRDGKTYNAMGVLVE